MLSNLRAIPCRRVAPIERTHRLCDIVSHCVIARPGYRLRHLRPAKSDPIPRPPIEREAREVRGFERVLRDRYSLPDAGITDDLSRYRAPLSRLLRCVKFVCASRDRS